MRLSLFGGAASLYLLQDTTVSNAYGRNPTPIMSVSNAYGDNPNRIMNVKGLDGDSIRTRRH
jgi:hypothetical protein